ncbi:DUF1127 domain-containing protein [Ochrobactrum sp. CM-21-5]|nr:DUF1127 domain-containing protein [Ochrobactrum sp. CM-21-5]MBC2886507.1 DUF1127 domain-containing protein [Ochrobactrum sp. CM-21-5]
MIAISKITTIHLPGAGEQVSTFTQMVKSVFASALRRWTLFNRRREVLNLNDFDDHILRDIGLQREDIYTAIHYRGAEDPTHLLCTLADSRRQTEAARRIS